MPTFDQHADLRTYGKMLALFYCFAKTRCWCVANKHRKFWNIWRHHCGVVAHELSQGVFRVGGEQPVAAGGHHDRVDDHQGHRMGVQVVGNGVSGWCVAKHPDFHRVDLHIIENRIQLGKEKLLGWGVDIAHPLGVLGNQRGCLLYTSDAADDTASV